MKSLEAQLAALETTFNELADVLGRDQRAWLAQLPTSLGDQAGDSTSTAERIAHIEALAGRLRQ